METLEPRRTSSPTSRTRSEPARRVITVRTLADGGQSAPEVARWVVEFLDQTARSLDVALYDVAISGGSEEVVIDAIRRAVGRGVAVRILFNVDDANPIPVPPPPRTDSRALAAS